MRRKKKNGEYIDRYGTSWWFKNWKLHREDGPAIKDSVFGDAWFLDGQEYTEIEFQIALRQRYFNSKLKEKENKKVIHKI